MTRTSPLFVALGEVMLRETPADHERLERTRQVWWSSAGAELNVAVGLARLGVPSRIITRLPDNPLGKLLRSIAKEHGVCEQYVARAPADELVGRMPYDPGVPPRPGAIYYQRRNSAASRLTVEEVDWKSALCDAKLFHSSGITMGLAAHSGYARNYLLECFEAANKAKPAHCKVSFDFNYRSTLWSREQARASLEPLLATQVDILIASVEDLASFFGIGTKGLAPSDIVAKSREQLSTELLKEFSAAVFERFPISLLALTRRYDQSSHAASFESVLADRLGNFARSNSLKQFEVVDRIGGGDAWAAGLFYRLLAGDFAPTCFAESVEYGDAAMQLHQTAMFDLPIVSLSEVEALVKAGAETSIRIKR